MTELNRRRFLTGLAAAASAPMLAAPAIANPAPRGARALRLINTQTGERFDDVYYDEGLYEPDAMAALDHLMRDHHRDEAIMMDVRLYDLIAGLQRHFGEAEPIRITSAYRTRATNDMLRRRTRWAARNSLHIQGMAADIKLPGVRARALERAALGLKMGGVGGYRGADFIHVDVGAVRHWRR